MFRFIMGNAAPTYSVNGPLRQECLNENWFLPLEGVQQEIEAWRFYIQVSPLRSEMVNALGLCPKTRYFPRNGAQLKLGFSSNKRY